MTAIDEGEHPGTPRRKHRHDLGQEDHGPRMAGGITRTIQALLGLWIALTVALIVYALVDSTGDRPVARQSRGSQMSPQAPSGISGRVP